jgi:hypothetical protein
MVDGLPQAAESCSRKVGPWAVLLVTVFPVYIKGPEETREPALAWFRERPVTMPEFVEDEQGARLEIDAEQEEAAQAHADTLLRQVCGEPDIDRSGLGLGPRPPQTPDAPQRP